MVSRREQQAIAILDKYRSLAIWDADSWEPVFTREDALKLLEDVRAAGIYISGVDFYEPMMGGIGEIGDSIDIPYYQPDKFPDWVERRAQEVYELLHEEWPKEWCGISFVLSTSDTY